MRQAFDRERGKKGAKYTYPDDQGPGKNYVAKKLKDTASRRSSIMTDGSMLNKPRSTSEPYRQARAESHSTHIPVYSDDSVDLK